MAKYRFVTSRPKWGHGNWHYFKCPECNNIEFRKSFLQGVVCIKCGKPVTPHGTPEKI